MPIRKIAFAAAILLALTANAGAEGSCFLTQNFQNWKAPDARTIYIRAGQHDVYRLDLAASCPALQSISPHLITEWRGSNLICNALDWNLKVSRGFPDSAEGCIVKTMTRLTPDEAAAIPPKFKP